MRKKLFAILMSATMVASFMPSMAFAAGTTPTVDRLDTKHTYLKTSNIKNEDVEGWLESADKDYVGDYTPATCTKEGSVVLKCTADKEQELCTATKTFVIKADHKFKEKKLSIDEYAKLMQAKKQAGFKNDAQVAKSVKALKDKKVCYLNAKVCTKCGEIKTDESANEVFHVNPANTDDNQAAADAADCKSTYNCGECGAVVKKSHTRKAHSFESAVNIISDDAKATSEKKLCGKTDADKIVEKTYTCTSCGETATKLFKGNAAATEDDLGCRVYKNAVDTETGNNGKIYVKGTATEATPANGYIADSIINNRAYAADTTVTDASGNVHYAFTCTVCGHVKVGAIKTNATAVHKHVWEKYNVPATCTTPEMECLVCKDCGIYANKDQEDAKTLDSGKSGNDPAESGKNILTEVVRGTAPLGHDLEIKTVEATCEVPAHYEITCKRCKKGDYTGVTYYEFSADTDKKPAYIKASDDYSIIDPAAGNTAGRKDIELKYLDPTVKHHKMTQKVVLKPATCTVNELSGYKCETCGKMDVHNVTEKVGTATGHKAVKVNEQAATCGARGTYQIQCENCKKFVADSVTGDKYDVTTNADWTKKAEDAKTFDGAAPVVALHAKCDFSKWVVVKDSTVFEEGVKELHCTKCNDYDGNRAPVAKKTVAKATVTLKAGKNRFTVKASAANATGYKVVYKRAGKKAITKVVDAENLSKTYTKLAKGKKYTVKVTAFASNGTDTVYGATTTKTVKTK